MLEDDIIFAIDEKLFVLFYIEKYFAKYFAKFCNLFIAKCCRSKICTMQ